MTGTVTWEVLTAVVGFIIFAGLGVAGFLLWLWGVVQGLRKDFEDAMKERDTAAQIEAQRAKIAEETVARELAEYRVHAAETFATKDGVTQAVGRMETAIERLTQLIHDSIERVTNRLDRILDKSDA